MCVFFVFLCVFAVASYWDLRQCDNVLHYNIPFIGNDILSGRKHVLWNSRHRKQSLYSRVRDEVTKSDLLNTALWMGSNFAKKIYKHITKWLIKPKKKEQTFNVRFLFMFCMSWGNRCYAATFVDQVGSEECIWLFNWKITLSRLICSNAIRRFQCYLNRTWKTGIEIPLSWYVFVHGGLVCPSPCRTLSSRWSTNS